MSTIHRTITFAIVALLGSVAASPSALAQLAAPMLTASLSREDYTQALQHNATAEDYYNRGLVFHDRSQFSEAIQNYTTAVQLDPKLVDAYFSRGLARSDLGDQKGAISDYTQALRLSPNLAEAYYNRGLAYFSLGDRQEALEDYVQAQQLNPHLAYYDRGSPPPQTGGD